MSYLSVMVCTDYLSEGKHRPEDFWPVLSSRFSLTPCLEHCGRQRWRPIPASTSDLHIHIHMHVHTGKLMCAWNTHTHNATHIQMGYSEGIFLSRKNSPIRFHQWISDLYGKEIMRIWWPKTNSRCGLPPCSGCSARNVTNSHHCSSLLSRAWQEDPATEDATHWAQRHQRELS